MTTFRCDRGRGGGLRSVRRGLVRGAALAVAATPAIAQELMLPSGLSATLYDVVLEESAASLAPDAFTDPEAAEGGEIPEDIALDAEPDSLGTVVADVATGGLARFRLSAPHLAAEGAGYETVAGDFLWLCENLALPALAANDWQPVEVVIVLSDREVEFGSTDPEAVQFFEGFRIADGACVPQAF